MDSHERLKKLETFTAGINVNSKFKIKIVPTDGFTSKLDNETDRKLYPSGFLVTVEKSGILSGSKPLHPLIVERAFKRGMYNATIANMDSCDIEHTEKGVWVGFDTIDKLLAAQDHSKTEDAKSDAITEGTPGLCGMSTTEMLYERFSNSFGIGARSH